MFIEDISETEQVGKETRIYEVSPQVIDDIHRQDCVEIPDDAPVYPNQSLVLRSGQQSALALVSRDGNRMSRAYDNMEFFDIRPRNKEQCLLMNILADPEVRLVVVTGPAGTGKTVVIGSHLLTELLEHEAYDKITLAKPLEIVTSTKYWGTVPGDEDEKFSPFLKSYQIMFEGLIGRENDPMIEKLMQRGTIDFLPLELMRGSSLKDSIVWYDEAQNLNDHECESLGSRIDDTGGSKLILSGDLNQIDNNLGKGQTGIDRLVRSPSFKNSPHSAHIHLVENERGEISQLFYDVFSDDS